jgi:hypothetical protein
MEKMMIEFTDETGERWQWDPDDDGFRQTIPNAPDPVYSGYDILGDDTPLECGIEDPEICESCT